MALKRTLQSSVYSAQRATPQGTESASVNPTTEALCKENGRPLRHRRLGHRVWEWAGLGDYGQEAGVTWSKSQHTPPRLRPQQRDGRAWWRVHPGCAKRERKSWCPQLSCGTWVHASPRCHTIEGSTGSEKLGAAQRGQCCGPGGTAPVPTRFHGTFVTRPLTTEGCRQPWGLE